MPVIKGPILRLLAALLGGVIALALLFGALPSAAPSLSPIPAAVLAQGPIVMDGVASAGEWGTQPLITDALDVVLNITHPACGNQHPHIAPCFARSGYDLTGIWASYSSNSWYFRTDVDGVPGDSDSITGTMSTLGFGTDGNDNGPLHTSGDPDPAGVGNVSGRLEKYILQFGPSANPLTQTAQLLNDGGPGVLFTLSAPESTVTGEAIYSTTLDPGVIEWRIDKASLIPPNVVQPELWIRGFADSDLDALSEDDTVALLVLGIDIANICPTPFVVGDPATFDIDFTIVPSGTYPVATNVVITAPVPAGTTYSGCSGGPCSESGGLITWSLGTLPKGTTGTVSFQAVPNVTSGITTDAFITIAEGLRDETTAAGCIALAPTATPIPPTEPRPDKKDKETPVPAPPPTSTPTPTPVLTPTPTPVAPVTLPETGAPDGAVDAVGLLLLLAGGLLAGAGIGWRKGRAS